MGAVPARVPAARFHHVWGGVSQRVFVLNAQQAWTAEEGGRIRRTTDGGTTWHFQTTPGEIDGYVRGIHFFRRGPMAGKTGWAVGSNGRLITTVDGGQTWALVGDPLLYPAGDPLAGQPTDLWDVFFQDAMNGWVAGIRVLRRTLDGGQSWVDLMPLNPNLPASSEFYRFAFIGQGPNPVGIAVAEPGLIAHSEDGTTWATALQVPDFCPTLPDDLEMWDVQFHAAVNVGTAIGYAVGGQGNQCGGFLSTTDGGLTWVREASASLPPTVYGVAPLANGGAIACSYGGRAYRRREDATPQWEDISALLEPPLREVRVPLWGAGSDGTSTVWIAGLMNLVYKSADGGASWVKQRGAGTWRMRNIHFADTNVGWAVAQQMTILRTQDGGATWAEELPPTSGPNLNSVRFRDATHGIAVGNPLPGGAPTIFHYDATTAPPVWRASTITTPPVPPPTNAALESAAWAAPANNDAWAAGTKGLVMRSVDGIGQTWSYFPGPPASAGTDFRSVAFDGVDAVYFVGIRRSTGEARVHRLRYPALTWEDLSPGLVEPWHAVAALDTDVYVVGANAAWKGVIYKLDPASPPGAPDWKPVYPTSDAPPPQALFSVALVGSGINRTLFAGGERGAILRFQNGAWASLKSQTSVTLTGLSFLSPSRGFAVGHGSLDGQGVGSWLGLGDSAMVGYA